MVLKGNLGRHFSKAAPLLAFCCKMQQKNLDKDMKLTFHNYPIISFWKSSAFLMRLPPRRVGGWVTNRRTQWRPHLVGKTRRERITWRRCGGCSWRLHTWSWKSRGRNFTVNPISIQGIADSVKGTSGYLLKQETLLWSWLCSRLHWHWCSVLGFVQHLQVSVTCHLCWLHFLLTTIITNTQT